ncbi:hypothetical protein [Streptomyces sp. SPB162]|uniref:hypothetical protein n=1 Tax=Streptomyces sp. SPB162 TaxID=2940560 RepID=UPI0024054BAA|nr:hypothetical protein [Streptomyces sp. SPB162]MDF9815261.1 pullulanase/glycogen debranching enzyme [Streptomyces sp. SPB162]
MADKDDAAQLKIRAQHLRECAKQARSAARTLGTYLDGVVGKATPRATDPAKNPGTAIWHGPFADRSTQALVGRHRMLREMATALMGDATRWENAATRLDDEAKAKEKAKAPAGGN